jgi:phage gp46-like protein
MSRYDGDVRVMQTEDGGAIAFRGGQPDMDQGLSTAVYLSLWTEEGWWGNSVAAPREEIGSECEALESEPLSNKVRQDYEEAARQALAWMVSAGMAKAVTVEAVILSTIALGLNVTIEEPDGTTGTLRYRVNWQGQRAALGVTT